MGKRDIVHCRQAGGQLGGGRAVSLAMAQPPLHVLERHSHDSLTFCRSLTVVLWACGIVLGQDSLLKRMHSAHTNMQS